MIDDERKRQEPADDADSRDPDESGGFPTGPNISEIMNPAAEADDAASGPTDQAESGNGGGLGTGGDVRAPRKFLD